jgi:MIP family channel proteins
MNQNLAKQLIAEFIGTFALCFVGILAIHNNPGLLGVALAHGLTIAVMASAFGAISGGQFNPAVSVALFVAGKMDAARAGAYIVTQLVAASVAGFVLIAIGGEGANAMVASGTPDLGATVTRFQGIALEIVLTFFLVVVIFGTAVDNRAPKIGGLAIGLTVALDILAGGPISGAAMNPARTFGPALASGHWNNHIVYWVGPLIGGALAGLVYGRFLIKEESK